VHLPPLAHRLEDLGVRAARIEPGRPERRLTPLHIPVHQRTGRGVLTAFQEDH
jgi:hypothetical protein